MGADMMIATVAAPTYPREMPPAKVLFEFEHRAAKAVEELHPDEVVGRLEDRGLDVPSLENEDGEQLDEIAYAKRVNAALTEYAKLAVRSLLTRPHREIDRIHLGGRWYLATGGMSHGDPPTDAFDQIELINELGIFERPIE